jgi:hypothetical protein
MPRVGFEPTIPAFERVKTDHALDRAVTVMGQKDHYLQQNISLSNKSYNLATLLQTAYKSDIHRLVGTYTLMEHIKITTITTPR